MQDYKSEKDSDGEKDDKVAKHWKDCNKARKFFDKLTVKGKCSPTYNQSIGLLKKAKFCVGGVQNSKAMRDDEIKKRNKA
jgi:hypothetical protein